jgi:hypothetical protein
MAAEVVPLELSPASALRIIREIARDTRNIIVIGHGRERGGQRGITRRQMERCVQMGTITEGPLFNLKGNWQVNLYRHAAGEEVTCVVAIEWPSRLLIISAF